MKQLIMIIVSLIVCGSAFAIPSEPSNLTKLGNAWKAHPIIRPEKNDITIVYGGADVKRRPTTVLHTTTA